MFLNRGRRISLDSIESKPKMQKTEMLNGILICPNDYIILNKEDAQYCEYASVVEVRNAKFGVPHFLYFNSKEVIFFRNNTNSSDFERYNFAIKNVETLKNDEEFKILLAESLFINSVKISFYQQLFEKIANLKKSIDSELKALKN